MAVNLVCVPSHSRFMYDGPKIKSLSKRALMGHHCMSRRFACFARPQILPDERRSANYQPSMWSSDFVSSLKINQADDVYKERVKTLEEEVRNMINNEEAKPLALLELIDDVQHLGLGYRFEKDIARALSSMMSLNGLDCGVENCIHATSLKFRLLRQHGYEVSQDVFRKFKDSTGNFKACLQNDVNGLLSLYEASFFSIEGEHILDEAKSFAKMHLKNLEKYIITSNVKDEVNHTLELPLHYRMQRLEARWFIEEYSKKDKANMILLELAILDFNVVQHTLQTDLQNASRWWKSTGLANKLSFIRDRLMECFFWTVGMIPEPEFSKCRVGLTEVTALITTIDDVYDVYGSMDELQLFTDAVERWDVKAVKNLPAYMKLCYLALYNTVNELAYDTLKEQGEDVIPILSRMWADLLRAFMKEAMWTYQKHVPTLDEYLDNAWRSVSGVVILVHAYFLTNQDITKESLECLGKYHDLLRWSSMIFRLCNDLGTSTAELERGETANAIACYMRETGVSEGVAREHIRILIDENWKKMNHIQRTNCPFANIFIETARNLARIAYCTYQNGDGHGAPDSTSKKRIVSLIIDPIKTTEWEKNC